MNLQAMINVCGTIGLMTVTVNNDFFLSGSANSPAEQYLDMDGSVLTPEQGHLVVQRSDETHDTIAVVLEFGAPLCDTNEVLLHASSDPVIRVRRRQTYMDEASQKELQELVTKVRDHVVENYCNLDATDDEDEYGLPIGIPPPSELAPRMTLRGFGLVAHEVGTMRMDSPAHPKGVVDTDLKVHGYDNLYVCDLSVFPYSTPANPALTLSALSLRLADHLLPAPAKSMK
jgi:choline dehydrogenase-like flavoprotein